MTEHIDNREAIASDLAACKKAFDSVNIPWVLLGGTVLGYARYKEIMPWDTDLDVGIFTEITDVQWRSLYVALFNQGFVRLSIEKTDFTYGFREVEFNIDMYHKHKDGAFYCSFPTSTPGIKFIDKAKWFDEIQMVDFLGDKYPIPNHLEYFVEAHYGWDWRTNIIKDHEQYFTEKRGGRDQTLWTTSRASKHGDLWPKALEMDDNLES